MWIYQSPIGDMTIEEQPTGGYVLLFGGYAWGPWFSPEDVAEDVANFSCGIYEWDTLEDWVMNPPESLEDWTRVSAPADEPEDPKRS